MLLNMLIMEDDMNKSIEAKGLSEQHIPGYNSSTSRNWNIDGCPRCHGDVFLDTEDGDLLAHCLQCGYVGLSTRQPVAQVNPFESGKE